MKASIVIPSYNNAAWLARAVASCLGQTKKAEIVIVDDCSTDSTPAYTSWLKKNHPEIKIIRNHKNQGRSESRNIGNRAATGDVILVLDSDDMCAPKRVEWTLEKIEAGADLVYGSCEIMSPLESRIGRAQAEPWDYERAKKDKLTYIVHSTLAYTRKVAEMVPYQGGEIAELGIDDWDFVMRCASVGLKFDYCTQVLGAYRELSSGISKTRDQKKVNELKDKLMAVAA